MFSSEIMAKVWEDVGGEVWKQIWVHCLYVAVEGAVGVLLEELRCC